jgi:hypothetical protein
MAYGTAGTPIDLNAQVNQLTQMALQSGDHMGFFQKYLTSSNPNRLAAQLAQGMVQQQVQGADTQKNLNQPQPPTVLDGLEQQQGMAAMPTERGMFNPDVYAQGGIGAGLGEEPQGQAQMARGGVVAFQEAGSVADKVAEFLARHPKDARTLEQVAAERYRPGFFGDPDVARDIKTPEAKLAREARVQSAQDRVASRATAEQVPAASEASRPGPTQPAEPPAAPTKEQLKAAEKVTKLDGKIENAVNKGKNPTKLIEQRARLTEGMNAGRPTPTVQPSGIASPGPTANATVEAVTPKVAPTAGGVPPQAPPPGATAAPAAAPGTPPPAAAVAGAEEVAASAAKPGTLRYDLDRLKAAAARARPKIPTPWQAVKGVGRGLGTAGLLYGTGQTAYDLTNAGINALDTEGNFRNSVSNSPFFQSAEAEQAAQNLTKPVPQSEIDAYRKQRLTREGVAPDDNTMLQMIYGPESGGDSAARNPLSGASGKGQLLETTFKNIQAKTPALKDYTWKDYQSKPEVQDIAANALLQDVKTTLKNKNIPVTTANVYTAWFGGPKLAEADDKAKIETVFSKQELAANPWVSGKTVGQVKQTLMQKMATANAPKEKEAVNRAVDFAAQTPRNVAVAMGADPNAAEAIPQTRQEWVEHLQRSLSPGQLLESGRTGLNAARMGTANAMEAMFGAKPDAAPAPQTVQEQYAEMMKNQAGQQAPAGAAPKDNKLFGYDRDRLGNIFLQSGAATLANPSQYALTSVGKGLQAGLTADEVREGKLAERTAKAEEGSKNRAEKQYEARQKSAAAGVKQMFPDPERSVVEIDTLVNYAALKGMSPMARRVNGFDDATYKELEKTALKLMQQMKGAPAAGDKGKPPSDNWGQIQKSGG